MQLARTHLTDDPGRSKNPLKKAMRRRNAKKVEFSTPTYYEPDPRQWPPEEDEVDEDGLPSDDTQAQDERNGYEGGSSAVTPLDETHGDLADRWTMANEDGDFGGQSTVSPWTGTEATAPQDATSHDGENSCRLRILNAANIAQAIHRKQLRLVAYGTPIPSSMTILLNRGRSH